MNLSFPPKPVIVSLCDVPLRSSLPCVPFGFLLELSESVHTEDGNGRGGCSLFGGGGDFTVIEMTPILVLWRPRLSVTLNVKESCPA